MAFNEDLSVFFDVAGGFAVQATLDGAPVQGIYTAPTADASALGYGSGLDTLRPTFVLPATQAAGAAGKGLSIAGLGTWRVAGVDPDGTGLTTLHLEKP